MHPVISSVTNKALRDKRRPFSAPVSQRSRKPVLTVTKATNTEDLSYVTKNETVAQSREFSESTTQTDNAVFAQHQVIFVDTDTRSAIQKNEIPNSSSRTVDATVKPSAETEVKVPAQTKADDTRYEQDRMHIPGDTSRNTTEATAGSKSEVTPEFRNPFPVVQQGLNLLEWNLQILQSSYHALYTQVKILRRDVSSAEQCNTLRNIEQKIEETVHQINLLKRRLLGEVLESSAVNFNLDLPPKNLQLVISNIWGILNLVTQTFHQLLIEQQRLSKQTLLGYDRPISAAEFYTTQGTQTDLKSDQIKNYIYSYELNLDKQANYHQYTNMKMKLQKMKEEKEALKQAVRAQKERADRYEETLGKVKKELMEKSPILHQIAGERDKWKSEVTRMVNENIDKDLHISIYKRRVSELETLLKTNEQLAKTDLEEVNSTLQLKTSELAQIEADKKLLEIEKKHLEERITHLESQIKHFDFKGSKKASEAISKEVIALPTVVVSAIEKSDKCVGTDRVDVGVGTDKINLNKEIMTIPLDHKEVQTALTGEIYAALIAGAQLHESHYKSHHSTGENYPKGLAAADAISESSSMMNYELITKQDIALSSYKLQLDERQKEIQRLQQQLEQVREDFQSQLREMRESLFHEEKINHKRIAELEQEISSRKQEILRVKTEKQEVEYELKNRIKQLERNLELVESSKTELQNHLLLIRNSYTSLFSTQSRVGMDLRDTNFDHFE